MRLGRRFLTLREGSVIVITIVVAAYFSATTDAFLTWENFKTLLPYFAPFAILAAGEVFLMINGEIDLSIGAVYLFAPFMFYEIVRRGPAAAAGLVLAMVGCMVVGLINGVFTAVVGINSFITTLGMLLALEGVTLIISDAQPVATPGTAVTGEMLHVRQGLRRRHLLGAHLGAGSRDRPADRAERTRAGASTPSPSAATATAPRRRASRSAWSSSATSSCAALCAGLVGVLEAVRTTSVQPDPSGANSVLFDGISAAVIGGTLLAGGSGTVVGALIGALLLGILNDGLIIKGVNADYLSFYLGLAIIFAMAANTYVGRVRTKGAARG